MFPTLLELGPVKLHMYGLMIAIGFLIALHFIRKDAEAKLKINPDDMTVMALWALFWGVVGTRILHIIMFPEGYAWNDPIGWVAIQRGGLVFQGAIPAGVGYAVYALRKRKISFWGMADVVIPWIPLAQGFGRIGCFFNGCCYGIVNGQVPWAISFPPGSPPHRHQFDLGEAAAGAWSLPVHPTQLYEAVGLMIITGVLLLLRKRLRITGALLAAYMVLTGILRFIVEFFRGDGNPTSLGLGLITNQQVFSLILVLIGFGLFLYLSTRRPASRVA